EPQTIEDILREKGETVVKGTVKDASKADQTVVAGAIADAVDDRGEIKLREGETLPDVQIEGLDEDSIRKLQLEIVRKQREEQDAGPPQHSYHHGMVGVRCPGCGQAHLISDSLGCFAGIPRSDHVRIRERFEDLISSSARMYGDLPDQHKLVLITRLFVVGVRSAPRDDEAEVLSGVISLLSWVLQFTLPLVFVGIYFKLTNGRTAPICRAAVEKVEVVEGGEKAGSDGNSFDMAPRMSDDDDCGHDGKSSDYDGDSEGSVGDDEESASEETDGKMGKSCEKLFAESFVIDENELESTDDLLRRINEDNDDSCRVDDDDGRSEISSPEASPIVHNTFGEDNIWKPKPGSSSCSSPANLPASTLPNSWDAFDAVPAGNDGSYLGTSLDEVLEFNEKCEAEASGEGHQELYNGLEDHRRDGKFKYAAFVCHQLLQNLTSEKILIQPET
ncbi:hypothetical protein FOZ62_014676, partial [Perkinsus olseni]